jgi:hypothetical protein
VDWLVLLASVGLLRTGPHTSRRNCCTLWLAFGLGIAVSLAANIAAAPALGWQPILVAGWPPFALLLAVELLADRPRPGEPAAGRRTRRRRRRQTAVGKWSAVCGGGYDRAADLGSLQRERVAGRTPTGAELDRIAAANNYGRAVLARWRRTAESPIAPPSLQVLNWVRCNGHTRWYHH